MASSTITLQRPTHVLAVFLGVLATLIVVGILSQSYFRPHDALAVQGASSVVCGSPSLLMTGLTSGPGIATFTSSGTQQLLSCTSPFGGTTQTITLRAKRSTKDVNVTFNIYVDGSASPLVTVASNRLDNTTPGMAVGWSISPDFISTSVPIKFNTSLTVTATLDNGPTPLTGTSYAGAHAQFTPDAQEVPIKFLNPPTVNIGGQPIQVKN